MEENNTTVICPECGNPITVEDGKVVGDIIECETCLTTCEVVDVADDGALEIELVEEEK